MLGREHHARVGRLHVDAVHQPQVARPAQDVVGDAGNDQLGVLNSGVAKRVRVCDVAVDALDVLAAELAHDRRVEIDDQDLLDELARLLRRAFVLELVEDRAGVAEEAKKDHRAGGPRPPLRSRRTRRDPSGRRP